MHASLLYALALASQTSAKNVPPQIGYVYPTGGRAGTTIDVRIGAYDWTPDMQIFPCDAGVKIELTGPASEPLLTPPPYWFGQKASNTQPPVPCEVPARITLPADMPPGPIRWQAANANGATNLGTFVVESPEANVFTEPERTPAEQPALLELPTLPVIVSGRISRITEIDRYRFTTSKPGLVVCRLDDQLGQPFSGVFAVRNTAGKLVADAAGTTNSGSTVRFVAEAGKSYTAELHDVEFGGDRGYVYRLAIEHRPDIVGAAPLVVARGATTQVEFFGWGVATGALKIESIAKAVAVPKDAGETFVYTFDTPAGRARHVLAVTDAADKPEPATDDIASRELVAGASIAGSFDKLDATAGVPLDRYVVAAKKGEAFRVICEASRYGSSADPSIVVLDPEGKELARNDDGEGRPNPSTRDAALDFSARADGNYEIQVADYSGLTPSRALAYRLTVAAAADAADFELVVPDKFDAAIGAQTDLALKLGRIGAWKGPIAVRWEGLPAGTSQPADAATADTRPDVKLPLVVDASSAATAGFATIVATAQIGERMVEHRSGPILVTATMKPRCVVMSATQDGGRIVNRGTTYPAEVILERLEGYAGPVTLRPAATQQRQRRGINGPSLTVHADAGRAHYPVFMPEYLETSLTCRMNLITDVEVTDPKGNLRHVTGAMDGLIVMSVEGALLKLSHEPGERVMRAGATVDLPLRVSRSVKLPEAVRVELVPDPSLPGLIAADPLTLPPGDAAAVMKLRLANDPRLAGDRRITIRATAMQQGKWPVVSETTVPLAIEPPAATAAK